MPQTSYFLGHVPAIAGMVAHRVRQRGRYENSEDLPPGRFCQYLAADAKLRLPRDAVSLIGVVPYQAALPPGGYKVGEHMVGVLREGQIWVEYAGTAPTVERPCNVMASSTIATDRGKVTGSAPSATPGAEIYAVEGVICIRVEASLGLALIEINI